MKNLVLFLLITTFALVSCKKEVGVVSESEIPPMAKKVNVKLEDGSAELISFYTEPLKPRHGESFKVVTFWKFNKQLPEGYKMFFHFEDEKGEQRFKKDRFFLDGKAKNPAVGKIIRDDANIKELPAFFDSDKLVVNIGLFKGNKRYSVQGKYSDGKNRIKLPVVKTDKPNIVRKKFDAYVVASDSRKQIRIDGKLKESFWKNAQTGGRFWRTNGKKMADSETDVMIAYDDKYLYVGWNVKDKDIFSPYKKNDDPIYNRDVVEIFIDADGDKDEYYELQVSPAGVKFDSSFKGGPRKNQDIAWDSGMKFAVSLDGTLNKHDDVDKGWTAEMAIPFSAIKDAPNNPPKDGDTWKMYLYRIDHSKKGRAEYTAWIPPYRGDFHYLRFMGDLKFVYEEIL